MTNTAMKTPQQDNLRNAHFDSHLSSQDPDIYAVVQGEWERQSKVIELIASENYTSRAVMEAQGSGLTNKYAEGYPGKRYYGGCEEVDKSESIAIDRVCKLFGCNFANVQPHSGSQANQAVYMAFCQPGDTVLGMDLNHGGHLTHGSPVNQSGKWFNIVSYGLTEAGEIDYDAMLESARTHKPKMIIAGASAYSRVIDWEKFRAAADEVGAIFLADAAHYAGLIAGGVYPSPFPHAHIMTTTTHKTLRGPRGGLILSNDEAIAKKLNSAIFPGLQGGPLEHVIAAKAVCFGECLKPEFKTYVKDIIDNARVLASTLQERGYKCVSGGTDSHVMLLDLSDHGLTGKDAEKSLCAAHLNCNRNSVPNDPQKPMVTSGLRLGTPAGTSRGFGTAEYAQIANLMADILDGLKANGVDGNEAVEAEVRNKAMALCARFPIYSEAI